ncbi:phage late control D protein (GPD) [Roseibium sp. TrichSKD4]|uniref:phage late control D family protein n=1 Tax=Roseibium sp. TrichSKD4 TaxID=744980 RepID=UPI0001E56D5D|nr:contractile injection system protein, VgrG/Pvc8 family [Roseibium sp. TrichSKD4]EFO32142.1 phage late control D protein (GPD) [Roseibium sp. TrichSKD4]
MKPYYLIKVNGENVTKKLKDLGLTLTITDQLDSHADTAQIDITDPNMILQRPETGAEVYIEAGWEEQGEPRKFGKFRIDQRSVNGFPVTISISAQTIDAKSAVKEQRTKAYPNKDYPTYGDIFREIASRNGWSPAIADRIDNEPNDYEAQSEENDIAFATRLKEKLDAGVSIKDGHMVINDKASGESVTGKKIPAINVALGVNLISFSASEVDKPKFSKVEASWFDRNKVEHKFQSSAASEEGPTFHIRHPFQTEEEARRAASSKAREITRSEGSARFTINGDPFAMAGAEVEVSGLGYGVDGKWHAVRVVHTFSGSSAYTTEIECEAPTGGAKKGLGEQPKVTGSAPTAPVPTPEPTGPTLVGSGLLGDGPE